MSRIEKSRIRVGALLAGTMLAVSGLAGAQTKTDSQKDADAGIRFRLQVSEKEIGLPIYPGANRIKTIKATRPRQISDSGEAALASSWSS